MPGFMPGIHVFGLWKQDVDGRDKPGHDDQVQLNSGSERNFVVHVVALAAGTGHRRLALA
jgi:hypothetical protein